MSLRDLFSRRRENTPTDTSALFPGEAGAPPDEDLVPIPASALHPGDIVTCDQGRGEYQGGGLVLVNGQRVSLSSLNGAEFFRVA